MKVLQVIPAVGPRYGGPSQAVVSMCAALQTQKVDVLIATTDADGQARLPVPLGSQSEWRGVPTIFFRRQWSEAWKYSRPLARWLDAHAAEHDVVHIHAVYSHACVAAANACRRHRVPYVVRPLGTLDPWSLQQKPLRKRVLWHVAVRHMLHRAAAVHYTTVSEQDLTEAGLGLKRGVVVPLPVDDMVFDNRNASCAFRDRHPVLEQDPYVLALGRVHQKKGLELLLDAFLRATTAPQQRHWRLVVAGDGDPAYLASLQHRVQARNAESQVVFTGWIDGAEKIAALYGAELLGLTSYQENFGLSVAEAMACGIPVLVSTEVNLAKEISAADAGWVVPLEVAPIQTALSQAMERIDERRRRGERGHAFARTHFTRSAVGTQLLDLYRAVRLP